MFEMEPVKLYTGDPSRVFVRILETRNDYPATWDTTQPRYLAAGDITTMTKDDAARYVEEGKARYL